MKKNGSSFEEHLLGSSQLAGIRLVLHAHWLQIFFPKYALKVGTFSITQWSKTQPPKVQNVFVPGTVKTKLQALLQAC